MKKQTSVPKRKCFWKTLLYCQNELKWLLKNTSVPKRKRFWKRLLYLKENLCSKLLQFVQKYSGFFVQSTTICSKVNLLNKPLLLNKLNFKCWTSTEKTFWTYKKKHLKMYLKQHIKVPKTEVKLFFKMKNYLCTQKE